jgi:hypothetical protein
LLRIIAATGLLRVVDGGALRIWELAHLLLLLLPQRVLVLRILLFILEQQPARKLLVQLGLFGLFEPCVGGGDAMRVGRLVDWDMILVNDDVLGRVVHGLLRAAPGRDRDRSWQGEHRLRGPGRRPPSRRRSTYHKRRGKDNPH